MRWRYIEIQDSLVENGISSIGMPGWEAGLEREDLLLIPYTTINNPLEQCMNEAAPAALHPVRGSVVAGTYWAIGVLVTKTPLPVPLFVKPLLATECYQERLYPAKEL
ncbi:hypothetical protein EJ05DRAFT_481164, partial [Pseudovirgaria hyperparasitica]